MTSRGADFTAAETEGWRSQSSRLRESVAATRRARVSIHEPAGPDRTAISETGASERELTTSLPAPGEGERHTLTRTSSIFGSLPTVGAKFPNGTRRRDVASAAVSTWAAESQSPPIFKWNVAALTEAAPSKSLMSSAMAPAGTPGRDGVGFTSTKTRSSAVFAKSQSSDVTAAGATRAARTQAGGRSLFIALWKIIATRTPRRLRPVL